MKDSEDDEIFEYFFHNEWLLVVKVCKYTKYIKTDFQVKLIKIVYLYKYS